MPSKPKLTPEGALLKLVLDYLAAKRIHVRRNQVGRMQVGERRIPFGEKGEADCTAYVPIWGRATPHAFFILHLECKAGTKQTAHQKAWQADVEARGEFYLLVHDLDEVIAWLEAHR